jgi:hypothetical protein
LPDSTKEADNNSNPFSTAFFAIYSKFKSYIDFEPLKYIEV